MMRRWRRRMVHGWRRMKGRRKWPVGRMMLTRPMGRRKRRGRGKRV
jgi:hypothetical protein